MQYNYRGTYDYTQNYSVKDVVSYKDSNGIINYYMCLSPNNSSSPQSPISNQDSTYWGIINALSNFPNSVDTFINHTPINSSDVNDINTYNSLVLKTSRTPSEDDQINSLTQKLRNKLILSDDINAIQQSISNLQQFFMDSVNGYIDQKQSEFNTKVDDFSDKGTYNPSVQYYAKNIVTYNGVVYLAKQDNSNHAPKGGDNDVYWRVLSKQGEQGIPGVAVTYKGDYVDSTLYAQGDGITYNGNIYYAKQSTVGNLPTDTAHWQIFNYIYISASSPMDTSIAWLDTANKLLKYYDTATGLWTPNNADTASKLSDGTLTYTPTDISNITNQTLLMGSSTFNSTTGDVISHSIGNTNYIVDISVTSNPNGYLGEVWVSKAANSFVVYCSGSTTTTTFDYIVMKK